MASFIVSAAIRAVKSHVGIWKAYDSIIDLVPEITRDEWAAAVGQARADLATKVSEITKPLNRKPTAADFGSPIERRSTYKYWQQVEVYVRDKTTGARSIMHFTHRVDTLMSRMTAVNKGLDFIQGLIDSNPDEYAIDITGFSYTGTYPIVPPK